MFVMLKQVTGDFSTEQALDSYLTIILFLNGSIVNKIYVMFER